MSSQDQTYLPEEIQALQTDGPLNHIPANIIALKGLVTAREVWLRVVHETKLVYKLFFLEILQLVQAIDYYELGYVCDVDCPEVLQAGKAG